MGGAGFPVPGFGLAQPGFFEHPVVKEHMEDNQSIHPSAFQTKVA